MKVKFHQKELMELEEHLVSGIDIMELQVGGGSGGGSVNLFVRDVIELGEVSSAGGKGR